jgi:hypothetical protein
VQTKIPKMKFLTFPVMHEGAEHLAMGFLARRNIASYKAPQGQANFDLICIHPTGQHNRHVRVQVKSRYGTQGSVVPIRTSSLKKFDFLIVVALNVGNFGNGKDGSTGARPPDLYVFPRPVVQRHFLAQQGWSPTSGRFYYRGHKTAPKRIIRYMNDNGIELIAKQLAVARPIRPNAK